MNVRANNILLRCILNSCGKLSVEAELDLEDGSKGTASVPIAIKPGRREKPRSLLTRLGRFDTDEKMIEIINFLKNEEFCTQDEFDAAIDNYQRFQEIGSDITLALSLAFARAFARSKDLSLVQYLALSGSFQPRIPHPIVNIFSGGIHGQADTVPFQQIMIVPNHNTFYEDIESVLQIYEKIEYIMSYNSHFMGYSASSGMLVDKLDYRMLLELVAEHITRSDYSSSVFLGVDIAAEHLNFSKGRYHFAGVTVEGFELMDIYQQLIEDFHIRYMEDPFDSDDIEMWREFNKNLGNSIFIVGDDLFATNTSYIDKDVANGIQLKMNQAGTLSATMKAAQTARSYGMHLCLSHRSCETEDPAMCDLAVALGVDFIKIGGPRRGDRIIKYNQLLRLAEDFQISLNESPPFAVKNSPNDRVISARLR